MHYTRGASRGAWRGADESVLFHENASAKFAVIRAVIAGILIVPD